MGGRAMFAASYGLVLMIMMIKWQYSAGAHQVEPETKSLTNLASSSSRDNRKFLFGAERMTITQTMLRIITSTVPFVCVVADADPGVFDTRDGYGDPLPEPRPTTYSKRLRQLPLPDDSLPANLLASSMQAADTSTENSAGVEGKKGRKLFTVWKTKHTYFTVTSFYTDTDATIGISISFSDQEHTYPDCR